MSQVVGVLACIHLAFCLHTVVRPYSLPSVHLLESASLGVLFATFATALIQRPRTAFPHRDSIAAVVVLGSNIVFVAFAVFKMWMANRADHLRAHPPKQQARAPKKKSPRANNVGAACGRACVVRA